MLFLQALLFFMFGISVVAIPTSPTISDISRRQESKGRTPPSSPRTGRQDGNAQLEKPDLDGLWEAHSTDVYPPYTYMRISKGTISGIWPRQQFDRLNRRLEGQDWKRVDPASMVDIVSDFSLFGNLTF
jgi:hypothetical protein